MRQAVLILAASLLPTVTWAQSGAALPSTCTAGDVFTFTGATPNLQVVCASTSPPIWVLWAPPPGGAGGDGAAWGDITGTLSAQTDLATALGGKAPTVHTHAYEPANANLQAHVASAHAPATAQANADITKAEIEAKLTGAITSHTHAGGGAGATKLVVLADRQNTTTTFANVTDLTLAVATATRYVFDCVLTSTTAINTTATQIAVNGPTTSSLRYTVETATSATATHRATQTAYDTNTNPATGAAAVPLPIYLRGQMLTTAAGTLAIRFRSEIATSAVNVLAGSYCLVE